MSQGEPVPNEFPAIWFETFLSPDNQAPVERELAFIGRHLPVADYRRVLDIPCGIGRHSGPLSALGYGVLGVDRSEAALAVARKLYPQVEFLALDMFQLSSIERTFDAVLCLWQSFGYGDADPNRKVLRAMRQVLRPGGRVLLDIYNADAVAALPTQSTERRAGRTIQTRRLVLDRRLQVELTYSDAVEVDRHEWEIFTPGQISQLAAEVDLNVLIRCAWFDEALRPGSEHLRMQVLLGRAA
jgi:SAM-dependent methyltransferase